MRLLSLELEKFGAFAALRIAFRRDARLHVVYGPNEAGKSTALAAVGALLFGVPERTPYASRFPAQLRIGAEIATASGRALKFWRRKGRKATLLEASGSPLPDDALAPFLGGLSQEVFERSFGLDAARLRAGGDEMLRADGDVGSSLLAAASGLRASPNFVDLSMRKPTGFSRPQGTGAPLLPGAGPLRRRASGDPRKGNPQRRLDETERRYRRARRRAPPPRGRETSGRCRAGAAEPAEARGAASQSDPGAGGGGRLLRRSAPVRPRRRAGPAGSARRIAFRWRGSGARPA